MIGKKSKGNTRRLEGFTIIEVLIVLAIAALIIIIVLLAVPAVQRSQRNQARRTDAKALLASVSDFASNNGSLPPSNQTDIDKVTGNTKFSYFDGHNVFFNSGAPVSSPTISDPNTTPAAGVLNTETINVYVGYTCTSATDAPAAGNSRNVALEYVLEQATGNGQLQCVSS